MLESRSVRRVVVSSVLAAVPAVAWAAPVSWTGLGDGATWGDPLNWSGNAVPGPADDVTVDVAANPAITVSAGVSVRSLINAETITIGSGVSFAVATTASSSQVVSLNGATLVGGAWTFTGAGAFQLSTNAASTISGAAISGEVLLTSANARVRILGGTTFTAARLRAASTSVAFEPGSTLTGQIIADGVSGSCFVESTTAGMLTVAPGAAIGVAPGSGQTLTVMQGFWFSSGSLDLRGTVFNAGLAASSLTVRPRTLAIAATGRVENTGAGSVTLDVSQPPLNWSNAGTLAVSSGLLTLNGGWTNTGTLSVSGTGRLDLDGSFTSAGIGTIARSGGTIAVRGSWDNAAGYTLTPATGTFLVQGGVITGGSLTPTGGAGLDFTNGDGQLIGVAYGGDVVLAEASERARLLGGTTVASVRLQASGTSIAFSPGSVVNFPIIAEGSAAGQRYIEVTPSGPLTIGPSGSVQLAGTFTSGAVNVGQAFWFGSATTLTNNGSITGQGAANQTSRTVNVRGSALVNNGSVSVSGGAVLSVAPSGSVSNAGTISADTGTLTMNGAWSSTGTISGVNAAVELDGTFNSASAATVARTGGTVTVLGVWDNTGSAFVLTAARGDWVLRGGTVRNGTVDFNGGRLALSNADNVLDGVAFLDEVVLDQPNARTRVLGATTAPAFRLRGGTSSLGFGPGHVVSYPVIIDLTSAGGSCYLESSAGNGSWSIGPGGSVSTAPTNLGSVNVGQAFWYGRPSLITNQGSMSMSTAGRTMVVNPQAFTNTGTVSASAGTVDIRTAQGTLSNLSLGGSGTQISVNGSYTLAGALAIASGTTLSLDGTWSNTGAITLSGTLNLGGAFTIATLGGFTNTGGTVNITGALDNTGGTLALTPATGSWRLAGGSITGGTVTQTGGARLQIAPDSGNLLAGVAFPEEVVLSELNSRVRLSGAASTAGYRLSAGGCSIAFAPGSVVDTTITCDGPAGSRFIETTAAGPLTLGPAGRIQCSAPVVSVIVSGQWFGTPAFTNLGVVEKSGSGSFTVNNCASLDPATHTLTGGVWRFLNTASVSLGGEVWVNNAAVEFSGQGSVGGFTSLRENNGSLTLADNRDVALVAGAGGVQSFTNRGLLRLGAGSRLQLGNSQDGCGFTQTASGTLSIDLGGNDTQTGFGSLRVFGNAALDGTVQAQYVNGFPRACGQVFQFLDANSRAGQFASTDLPGLTDETLFLLFYGGADARFSVSARADFNQDGFLDFFDYDDFVNCFESLNCPPGITADFNNDGFVDFFDYDDFVFRFEAGC